MRNLKLPHQLSFFLAFIVCSTAFGQNVKKEGLGYFNYLKPRASIQLDQAQFYFLKVQVSDDDLFRRKLIEDKLEINWFKKAGASDQYTFTIDLKEAPFRFGKAERKFTSRKAGDKTITEYYYIGNMGYHYTLKVLDLDGNELYRDLIKGSVTTKGSKSTSMSKAMDMHVREKFQAKEKVVNDFIKRASTSFNENFTDVESTIHMRVPYVISKKYEYESFDNAYALLKESYNALNDSYDVPEEFKIKLETAINLWEGIIAKSTPEDKKSQFNSKVTAACHFNSGIAAFILNDFEYARIQFEKALEINDSVIAGIPNWIHLSSSYEERINKR